MTQPLSMQPPATDSPLLERLDRWMADHPELDSPDHNTSQEALSQFLVEVSKQEDLSPLETAELMLLQAQMVFASYQMAWAEAEREGLQHNKSFTLTNGRVLGSISVLQSEISMALQQLRTVTLASPHGMRVRRVITL